MTNDEIGALGQDLFKTWCSQARITAVPAYPDKGGWDFFLQMPVTGDQHDAPERSCKVQVKTTTKDAPAADIKLSNWEKMAKERGPWFVMHILLDGVDVREAYLLHVDETHVGRVLERIRKLDPAEKLHDIDMRVTASDGDALPQPFHESMRERLVGHLNASEEAYYAAKSTWIKSAGYEGRPYTYTITAPALDDDTFLAQLADWAVGLIERLPFSAIRVVETRFGVTLPVKDIESTEGYVEFNSLPSLGPSTVRLMKRDGSESVEIKCTTHVANKIVPFLTAAHARVRLVGSHVSFLMKPQGDGMIFGVHFGIPGTGARPLSEAAKACKALRLFAEAPVSGVLVEFVFLDQPAHVQDLSEIRFDADAEFERFARVMEGASYLARHFDLDPDMSVDVAFLLRQDFQINLLAAGLNRAIGDWGVGVRISATENPTGKRSAVVLGHAVRLGSYVVSAVFALVGEATWTGENEGDGTLRIDKPDVRVCFEQAAPRSAWSRAGLAHRIAEVAEQLDAESGIEIVALQQEAALTQNAASP